MKKEKNSCIPMKYIDSSSRKLTIVIKCDICQKISEFNFDDEFIDQVFEDVDPTIKTQYIVKGDEKDYHILLFDEYQKVNNAVYDQIISESYPLMEKNK